MLEVFHKNSINGLLINSSLATWIAIVKKVIRSARRKMKQGKQHQLTKFFPIKTMPKRVQKPDEPTNKVTYVMKQQSIDTFLDRTKIETSTKRLVRHKNNNIKSNNQRKSINNINNAPITTTNPNYTSISSYI